MKATDLEFSLSNYRLLVLEKKTYRVIRESDRKPGTVLDTEFLLLGGILAVIVKFRDGEQDVAYKFTRRGESLASVLGDKLLLEPVQP